jgi:hypothetical protein
MKPIFEKLPVNSGGELSVIQTTEHLFVGTYQKDMYCGVHLDVEEAKSLRSLLNRYIEGVANE